MGMSNFEANVGPRRAATWASILLAALLVIPGSAAAISDPSVTELVIEGWGSWGEDLVAFTVTNPSDSSLVPEGQIVGFAVESDFPADVSAPAGWKGSWLSASKWDDYMPVVGANMTWSNFFGGISYPFGSSVSTGFYLDYFPDDVNIPIFSFLNTAAAISPGETLAGFNILVGGPLSSFVLAHVNNAGPPFGNVNANNLSGFSTFTGETSVIPEPSTAVLLGFGLLGALAAARRTARR
jgi:hypothetical protein